MFVLFDEKTRFPVKVWLEDESKLEEKCLEQAYNLSNLPSWEQIFYTRYFNSFIIREDNRHNTYINDYFLGQDALKEAERIENTIFEFEDDRWEY